LGQAAFLSLAPHKVSMNVYLVDSIEDPRLACYRNMTDRELARMGGLFLAEVEYVVQRLLASDFQVESVLVSRQRAQALLPFLREETPVYVGSDAVIGSIVGYKFHSGAIACGRRKPDPTLDETMDRALANLAGARVTLVVCPKFTNTANLGAMIRVAAGFGVAAILLGESSCDPFWRQAVRVSMGAVFSLPAYRSQDILRDLVRLKQEWKVELVASVLDPGAEPLERAGRPGPPDRLAILFGSEDHGLPLPIVKECPRKVMIPMELGTESLNVAMAAAVFLYHFVRRA
jgi:tRNA G18 (ribose-2'-O)-methylase SpoU